MTTAGHLILVAIEQAKNKIRQMASPLLEVEPADIEVRGKRAYVKGDEERAIFLKDLLTSTVKCAVGGDPKDWLLIKGSRRMRMERIVEELVNRLGKA